MTHTLAYPPPPRRDAYGSMASAAIGNPLPAQVAGFFDRSDYPSPGDGRAERARVIAPILSELTGMSARAVAA